MLEQSAAADELPQLDVDLADDMLPALDLVPAAPDDALPQIDEPVPDDAPQVPGSDN